MSLYQWRAGEIITAEKLRAGVQFGLVNITPDDSVNNTGANSIFADGYYRGSATIEFDVPFEEIPTIQVTARTSVPGLLVTASYTSVSTTGMTVMIARGNETSTNVDWLAIGRPDL